MRTTSFIILFLWFIAEASFAQANFKLEIGRNTAKLDHSQSDLGFRIGGSYSTFLTDALFLRVGGHYETVNFYAADLKLKMINCYPDNSTYLYAEDLYESNSFLNLSIGAGYRLVLQKNLFFSVSTGLYTALPLSRSANSAKGRFLPSDSTDFDRIKYYSDCNDEGALDTSAGLFGLQAQAELQWRKAVIGFIYAYSINTRSSLGPVKGFNDHLHTFTVSLGYYLF